MRPYMLDVIEDDGVRLGVFTPNLVYEPSDEYNTLIHLNLSDEQTLKIAISPDYVDGPKVYVQLAGTRASGVVTIDMNDARKALMRLTPKQRMELLKNIEAKKEE